MTNLSRNSFDIDSTRSNIKESYISQEPSDYFTKKSLNVYDNPLQLAFYSFYEEHADEIYSIIKQDDPSIMISIDNQDPAHGLINIFKEDSTYNKDIIVLKTKQEIQCLYNDSRVESYIKQSKSDWYRTPFYSSKYNEYYEKKSNLPYTDPSPQMDKLFLITVDAINNYFMNPQYEPSLQINNSENIEQNIGDIDCDCEKAPEHPLICAGFNQLQIPNDNVKKILYNLSYINQSQRSQLMLNFTNVMQAYREQYDLVIRNTIGEDGMLQYNFGEGTGYYYMDAKNQAGVYINTLILLVVLPNQETCFVPLYKIIQVYPFELNNYYYTFLYVDNEPPAIVGEINKWYKKKITTPVTDNYYKFVEDKLKWYVDKINTRPEDFLNGKYIGADYLSYVNKKAREYVNTHKPYVSPPYKSPKFVPPEKTPITSPRLLGGKTRRKRKYIRKIYNKKTNKNVRRTIIRKTIIRRTKKRKSAKVQRRK
jgi:hypothetical protein